MVRPDDVAAARARAARLLRGTLVWDNHACLPLRPGDHGFLPQLERFRAVGADVVSVNVGFGPTSFEDHVRCLASFRAWLAARPEAYMLARSVADVDRARAANLLAIVFDIEGMAPFDRGEDGLIEMFYELGVRWTLIAYNRNNAAGGGCHDEDTGLTPHGRAILREMSRVGMVACCSHTGHRTARQVMDEAGGPVIFSHSNASAVHAHARNVPDELIRACAATGGVVGVNGIGFFLGDNDCSPEAIVRHIDHIAQLVGPDHVGISLDYVFDQKELLGMLATMKDTFPDPSYALRPNLAPPEAIPEVTSGLLLAGYGEADVAKIVGGNWRRVAQAVWR